MLQGSLFRHFFLTETQGSGESRAFWGTARVIDVQKGVDIQPYLFVYSVHHYWLKNDDNYLHVVLKIISNYQKSLDTVKIDEALTSIFLPTGRDVDRISAQ